MRGVKCWTAPTSHVRKINSRPGTNILCSVTLCFRVYLYMYVAIQHSQINLLLPKNCNGDNYLLLFYSILIQIKFILTEDKNCVLIHLRENKKKADSRIFFGEFSTYRRHNCIYSSKINLLLPKKCKRLY